jgi:UDP-hydrolysing UDP-N-acetyl-D-glucosamine 2-epimerase
LESLMAATRSICVVTGSRADYGPLKPVMDAIRADDNLQLLTVACGQHLDARFGESWRDITADGFALDAKVDFDLSGDSMQATAQATGRGVALLAEALGKLSPDIVLVLGDRYEILSAALAALLLNIPIAHIHGGETTEAAMDDAIRHAITKIAALHFAAAEPYARRIVQMGEDPDRVFTTGAPGLDGLEIFPFMTRDELAQDLGIDLSGRFFVVTYHPVTLAADKGAAAASALTAALNAFPEASVLFTGVNSDPGHSVINDTIANFAAADPKRRKAAQTLGRRRYLSAVKESDAVIGNSSSGLIEAPALGTTTINIGDRQKGRLRSASVIDCGEDRAAILAAVGRALDPDFKRVALLTPSVYGRGGAAGRIVAALKAAPLAELRIKRFHDIITRA